MRQMYGQKNKPTTSRNCWSGLNIYPRPQIMRIVRINKLQRWQRYGIRLKRASVLTIFFEKKVPARNQKESKGMIQGIFKEYLGHVLDKSWTHPRRLRDAFGTPLGRLQKKYGTTPKKKVDCFAQKLDFFTRKRGSQSTFCCNANRVGGKSYS